MTSSSPDYANMLWMIADCVDPSLNELFLDKFLDEHFLDILPHILTFVKMKMTYTSWQNTTV